MKENAKFSIITVCKNPGQSFKFSLDSLKHQSFSNFEYIVIDGNSTDGTVEIIEKETRIDRFISEPDLGIYDAMNKGIKLATGEYIYFLNCGDSFYSRDVLLKVSEYIDETHADFVYGDTCLIDPHTEQTSFKQHNQIDKYYLYRRPINHQAIFARRDLFVRVGKFDVSYRVKADHDWILRCLEKGVKFHHFPLVVANYQLEGFAHQNRSKLGLTERNRIQTEHFTWIGRFFLRISDKLHIKQSKIFRNVLNRIL